MNMFDLTGKNAMIIGGAGGLGLVQLRGEVGVGIIGEGDLGNNLHTQFLGAGNESGSNTGGISVRVVVQDSQLGAQTVGLHIVGSSDTLVGVGEAHLEDVVLAVGDVGGGSGGGQLEVTVSIGLAGNSHAGTGGGAAVQDLHAPVLQVVVSVDALFAVSFVVLEVQLELDAALGVDLGNCDLSALLGGDTVGSGVAGQGADAADLDGGGGSGLVIAAAGQAGQHHSGGHHDCKNLLVHNLFLL